MDTGFRRYDGTWFQFVVPSGLHIYFEGETKSFKLAKKNPNLRERNRKRTLPAGFGTKILPYRRKPVSRRRRLRQRRWMPAPA